jgi:uncharacterized protein (DUF4415 family)
MSKDEIDFSAGNQGPVVNTPNKTRITIRLDTDIVEWFRKACHTASGGNYQTMINDALRSHIESNDGQLEKTLRLVVREELAKYSTDP